MTELMDDTLREDVTEIEAILDSWDGLDGDDRVRALSAARVAAALHYDAAMSAVLVCEGEPCPEAKLAQGRARKHRPTHGHATEIKDILDTWEGAEPHERAAAVSHVRAVIDRHLVGSLAFMRFEGWSWQELKAVDCHVAKSYRQAADRLAQSYKLRTKRVTRARDRVEPRFVEALPPPVPAGRRGTRRGRVIRVPVTGWGGRRV